MELYTCGASSIPLLPACCPCSLSIPGSLELSWGLRKPPVHFPCPQLAPLTPSLLPLLTEHPWIPRTSLKPQEIPSSLPSLPACSPCFQLAPLTSSLLPLPPSLLQLAPSSLQPPSLLQLTPLAPACSQLSPASQLAPACSSLLPLLQLTPSLLPTLSSLPAHSQLSSASQLTPACSQLTPACFQMPMNSLVCIGVPTTSGGQEARGQGGSKLKLASLTPRSLPSIPSCSCHSPQSQLTRPHSQMLMKRLLCIWVLTTSSGQGARGARWEEAEPCSTLPSLPAHWTSLPMSNEQLTMYWGPHHFWGQGGRGQSGSKLKLVPLTPRSLPSLQLSPSLLQLTPSSLQLAPSLLQLTPAHSQLAPNG